jgi:hypothetical protein
MIKINLTIHQQLIQIQAIKITQNMAQFFVLSNGEKSNQNYKIGFHKACFPIYLSVLSVIRD